MEIILICVVVVFIIGYVIYRLVTPRKEIIGSESVVYKYENKDRIMTDSEVDFFNMLVEVASDRYFVFPQVHLSAIIEHKIKGQNWNGAFKHINGKSVDFVLCDKKSLKPVYAIELDDATHQLPDRGARDVEVERIFDMVNIPLVRFTNYRTMTLDDIAQKFFEAQRIA